MSTRENARGGGGFARRLASIPYFESLEGLGAYKARLDELAQGHPERDGWRVAFEPGDDTATWVREGDIADVCLSEAGDHWRGCVVDADSMHLLGPWETWEGAAREADAYVAWLATAQQVEHDEAEAWTREVFGSVPVFDTVEEMETAKAARASGDAETYEAMMGAAVARGRVV